MDTVRLQEITGHYRGLAVAMVGDFCLDRYMEIDPQRQETSIETGLAVHNVLRVRAQPGGAGSVLGNLAALGVGRLIPLGFAGEDGEGFELVRALASLPGVDLGGFLQTPLRRTFTYCKPLVLEAGQPPRELNRLDSKNWTPTPAEVEDRLIAAIEAYAGRIDAMILMEQVDVAETGVLTRRVLEAVGRIACRRPAMVTLADSRRGLGGYPAVGLKMNRVELGLFLNSPPPATIPDAIAATAEVARRQGRRVFVTLAEDGLVGADPGGEVVHQPALPIRGPIDIVGAGDCVSANLTVAQAAAASLAESLELASAAASVVIHQLGTTGSASPEQIAAVLAQ